MSHHRVTITALHLGQTVQNVLHFINTNGVFTPQQIAGDVKSNWVDKVSTMQNNGLKYISIAVQTLEEGAPAPFILLIDKSGGGLNDTRMPTTLSFVLKLQTAVAGKSGRGRVFLGGVYSDAILGGFVTASYSDQFTTTILGPIKAAYIDDGDNPLTLCVRNKNGGMAGVTNIQLRGLLGVQRRRNIGVGI